MRGKNANLFLVLSTEGYITMWYIAELLEDPLKDEHVSFDEIKYQIRKLIIEEISCLFQQNLLPQKKQCNMQSWPVLRATIGG